MLEFALSGLGSVSGHLIDFSGTRVVLVKDLGVTVCNALEDLNPGFVFLSDESISQVSTLLWENQGKAIDTVKAVRDKYGWGLRKSKLAHDVATWRNVTSVTPIEFTVTARSFAPLKHTVSSRRLLVQAGALYGVPTILKIEVMTFHGGDKALLHELFKWAQNDTGPWIYTGHNVFHILSCSDETCCSMSYGDKVTIYDETLPGTQRTYLCDHNGWTAI